MIKGPRLAQDVTLEESGTLPGFRNAPVGQIGVEGNLRIGDNPREIGRGQFRGENHVTEINRRLPGFWREDRHLSFFLAFLVLMTIFVPMVGESRPGRIAIELTFALMLFSGAIATVSKRTLMYLIIALTILEFTADLIVEFNPAFSSRYWGSALAGC